MLGPIRVGVVVLGRIGLAATNGYLEEVASCCDRASEMETHFVRDRLKNGVAMLAQVKCHMTRQD